MQNIFYQPPGVWFGDCMPFGLHDTFYLFHQRDTRNPAPFGEPFGWHLSTTKDFVHYEDHGIALPRGTDEEQDQFIFAGSVFMQNDGTYRIFYTGYNRDYPTQGKPSQVLLQAVSKDALHWEKVKEAVELPPQPGYDPDDWRDPFVLWDEEKQHYLLILGTRLRGPKTRLSGRTVHFTSPDLKHWDFGGDFWAPDTFAMHEMPDLFRIGDWWYHLISEYCDKNRTVYRMAKSFYGPWLCPPDEAFDGRAYYAARTYALGKMTRISANFNGAVPLWPTSFMHVKTVPWALNRQIPCGISLIHLVRFPICACKAPTHVNRMSLCQIRAIFSVSPAPFHFRRAQLASASAYMGMKRKVPRINIISAFPNIASCLKNRPAYRGRQSTITAFLAQSNLKHTRNIRFALFVMIPSPSFI